MTGDSHTLIEAAGEYLAAGLVLLAVSGKLPNGKFHRHWKEDAIFGVPESAEDVELLARIFGDESTTGIAVVLPANLLVVDIDGEDGAQAWHRLAERHGFDLVPDTPITRTGKGLHLWFLDGRERRNGTVIGKMDAKTIGGYVLVPPSRHPSGAVYEWLTPLVVNGRVVGVDWLPW